jgi:fimbrial isopeptide formation D2 family protein/LPXTG-motif cell wall-anchored protein
MKTPLRALLVAGLVALVSPALTLTASADDLPESGTLIIHKYIGSPVLGTDNDGQWQDPSGWQDVIPANGVVFDLYMVGAPLDPQWPDVPPQGIYVLNGNGNLQVYDGSTLIGEYALSPADPAQVTTSGDGSATAADLAIGRYLVIENTTASTDITNANTGETLYISQAALPFVVAVPMANADGTGWLDPVHVYPKNEALSVQKESAGSGAVMVGDTISYTITTTIPTDIADSMKFDIYDQLDLALDYVLDSLEVTTIPASVLVLDTDYTVSYSNHKLVVSFTEEGRLALDGLSHVIIAFDVTINASILESQDLTILNQGTVEFTNSNGDDFEGNSDPDDPGSKIHTAAIDITKYDQKGDPLTGATFQLATSEDNAKAGCFVRIDSATMILYDCGTQGWDSAEVWEIAPDNTASFIGLIDYTEDQGVLTWRTYWVVETAAPAGYNKLTGPGVVSFEAAYLGYLDPEDYNFRYNLIVKNSQRFILPLTGGAGTITFSVASILLLGAAGLIIVTRRKTSPLTPKI